MPAYVTLGAKDPAAAHAFYDAVLATIGWSVQSDFPGGWRAYSEGGGSAGFKFWVCPPFDGQAASAGNGQMLALPARFVDEALAQRIVDAFLAARFEGGRHQRRVEKIEPLQVQRS